MDFVGKIVALGDEYGLFGQIVGLGYGYELCW